MNPAPLRGAWVNRATQPSSVVIRFIETGNGLKPDESGDYN